MLIPANPFCRLALAHIVERTLALADYLSEGGATKAHNVDNLLLRESMDVIGALATSCYGLFALLLQDQS